MFFYKTLSFFFMNIILLDLVEMKNRKQLLNGTLKTTTPADLSLPKLDADVYCKFQPNGYDCSHKNQLIPKYYYDIQMEDCKTAYIGSCKHNLNIFENIQNCQLTCRDIGQADLTKKLPPKVFCRLQHDFGRCNGYYPMWYYDITERNCKGFSYSGCGGNMNRFPTQQICVTACSTHINY